MKKDPDTSTLEPSPSNGHVPLAEGAARIDPGRRTRRSGSRGGFGKDVIRLVTGTVFAQGITLALSPILTRLYGPSAFGIWALFSSITTIIGVIACLRYDIAIMLPDDDEDGASLLGVSLVSLLTVTALSAIAVLAGGKAIVALLRAPAFAASLWLVPIAVLVNGIYLALTSWNSRNRRFTRLAGARVSGSAASSTVQLGLGYGGWATAGSLVASSLAGTFVSTAVLGVEIAKKDTTVLRKGIRWDRLRRGTYRYRRFPLYGSMSVLLNSLSWQLPAILLQRYFSAEVVGFYALGNRLLRVPMDLIGGAISQAFYPRAAAARGEGDLAQVVEAVYRRLVTIGFAPMVVLGIVASDLFRIAFGERWVEAGVYTQILAGWTFFWFISSPLSSLFSVLEMQAFGLKLNFLILGSRLVSLVAGGFFGNARLALVLFAVSGVLVYGYYSFAILAAAGVSWSKALRILGAGVAAVSPLAAVLIVGKLAGAPAWGELLLAAVSLAVFFVVAMRRDPVLLAMIKSLRIPGQ